VTVRTEESTFHREAADPDCLSPAEVDVLLRGAPWRRFAVLGDSIAEGIGEPVEGYRDESWAERITAALSRQRPGDFTHLNLGVRGLRTAQVRATQLEPALAFGPDLALVVTGGNDLLRPTFDGDGVEADLDAIVSALRARETEVVTATMFDITLAPTIPEQYKAPLRERLEALADRIRAVARAHQTLHVDCARHPASADPGIYASDLQHANRRGHAIAAAAAIRRLGERLGNRLVDGVPQA
jgi:lysophospholipase L1-like esterase